MNRNVFYIIYLIIGAFRCWILKVWFEIWTNMLLHNVVNYFKSAKFKVVYTEKCVKWNRGKSMLMEQDSTNAYFVSVCAFTHCFCCVVSVLFLLCWVYSYLSGLSLLTGYSECCAINKFSRSMSNSLLYYGSNTKEDEWKLFQPLGTTWIGLKCHLKMAMKVFDHVICGSDMLLCGCAYIWGEESAQWGGENWTDILCQWYQNAKPSETIAFWQQFPCKHPIEKKLPANEKVCQHRCWVQLLERGKGPMMSMCTCWKRKSGVADEPIGDLMCWWIFSFFFFFGTQHSS